MHTYTVGKAYMLSGVVYQLKNDIGFPFSPSNKVGSLRFFPENFGSLRTKFIREL